MTPVIEPSCLCNDLPSNDGAVPPSVSKAKEVGGSVVPTNGRPNLGSHMGNAPLQVILVTGQQSGEGQFNSDRRWI